MTFPLSRRELLQTMAAGCLASLPAVAGQKAEAGPPGPDAAAGWVRGHLTGAEALVETLLQEGVCCVYGIPGAQDNELWDTMKAKGLCYLLVTHEFSAAVMADGYARSTGHPGVLCVVPGPGVTNSLTGIGEALLDSVPVVCLVCDVARDEKHYKAFQVHDLPAVALLEPVTKKVFPVAHVGDIPFAVRQAFALAQEGEPGPVAVVIPFPLFIEAAQFHCPPLEIGLPVPEEAVLQQALGLLAGRKCRIGIYAGMGCMNNSHELVTVAELLQAPVATSVSGKGVIPENHPLAVGWGYGPQGTKTAETIFKDVELVLAIGVKYGEVSTAFYSIPKLPHLIHVDANPHNMGRIVKTDLCVHADAGQFLAFLLAHRELLQRPCDEHLAARIASLKKADLHHHSQIHSKCGTDPMAFILALRRCLCPEALVFVDVTEAEHWAAEAFQVLLPRTYFNPVDNQAMGWSVPAALGAQRVCPDRPVVTITGDGCFLMSGLELSTAARECLAVKFFILDDQAYHYMQALQKSAYLRTTATLLAHLDYAALAKGLGLTYHEILGNDNLEADIRGALCQPGPVLTRVVTDYGNRQVRWIKAARSRYTRELTTEQKFRFATRLGARALHRHRDND